MKLSEKEKAAQKAAFQNMNRKEKLDHVFTYYRWYIILGIIALIILISVIYRNATRKDPLVYLALTNVTIGEDMEADLTEGYIKAGGEDRKGAVYLYKDLYISENADIIMVLTPEAEAKFIKHFGNKSLPDDESESSQSHRKIKKKAMKGA